MDDWKPIPPWDRIDNEAMKSRYDLSPEHQYSFDNVTLVDMVDWVGCEKKFYLGDGWP